MATQVIESQRDLKTERIYNRLELLLEMTDYDLSFQPLKKYGLYVYLGDRFFLYGAGDAGEERLMRFIDNIINYRIEVVDPNDSFYRERYFHEGYDGIVNEHVVFTFILINDNEEHLLVPFLKNEKCILKTIEIAACIRDGRVLTIEETQKLIYESEKINKRASLEAISNWKPGTNNFFNDFAIRNFCDTHFGPNCIDIKKKYRELANQYHPDKGGDELMFRAITRAKEYLIEKSNLYGKVA